MPLREHRSAAVAERDVRVEREEDEPPAVLLTALAAELPLVLPVERGADAAKGTLTRIGHDRGLPASSGVTPAGPGVVYARGIQRSLLPAARSPSSSSLRRLHRAGAAGDGSASCHPPNE